MTARRHYPYLEHDGVLAFAHRGGALEAPENTMKAFQYAANLGYRYLETDAYASRDGTLISFHDDKLDRVTDRTGKIETLSIAELREAKIEGREPIPLLEELLAAWPDMKINIDPKHDAAVAPLIALIKRMGVEDRVGIGSFSDKRLKQIYDAFDGRVCVSLGPVGVTKLKSASLGMPGMRFQAGCVQVPVAQRGITIVDKRFVDAAAKRGLQVHVWTIDDADEMARLVDLGVHGLMTDRPKVLKGVLQQRGRWT